MSDGARMGAIAGRASATRPWLQLWTLESPELEQCMRMLFHGAGCRNNLEPIAILKCFAASTPSHTLENNGSWAVMDQPQIDIFRRAPLACTSNVASFIMQACDGLSQPKPESATWNRNLKGQQGLPTLLQSSVGPRPLVKVDADRALACQI